MSRIAREYPDQPEMWANPLGFAAVPPEPRECEDCDGRGGWNYSVEDGTGRDVDLAYDCGICDGAGVVEP